MRRRLSLAARAAIFALLVALIAALSSRPSQAAGEQFVMRVYFASRAERDHLLATLDILEHAVHSEGYITAIGNADVLARLQAAGYRATIDTAVTQELFHPDPQLFDNGYRTVEEVYAALNTAVTAHPEIAEIVDTGDSWCKLQGSCSFPSGPPLAGYDLLAFHITNRAIAGPKPVAFWIAAHHPREIHTTEIALRYIDWLLNNYGVDADATWMVDYHDIWVIPIGNPDAHNLVERGGSAPYWQRKNLNITDSAPWTSCGWPPSAGNQSGVDLNRNHDFHWRGPNGGWDSNPCGQTYPGVISKGPASEPEIQGYTALVNSLLIDQRGPGDEDPAPATATGIFVSIHSGIQFLLIPYDWRVAPAPNDADLHAVWGKVATWTPGWRACQTGSCYGIVSGSAADWAYGTYGVAAAVWEIGEFMPDYSKIDSFYWPFLRPMMIYTTRVARTPYSEARGPDANAITSTPIVTPAGSILNVTATIDDSSNGNLPVASAELYVDTPPWAGGTPVAMLPADGTFDAPVEQVQATLDVSALSVGRHMLFMRGRDNAGSWGPVFAIFTLVDPPGASRSYLYAPLVVR